MEIIVKIVPLAQSPLYACHVLICFLANIQNGPKSEPHLFTLLVLITTNMREKHNVRILRYSCTIVRNQVVLLFIVLNILRYTSRNRNESEWLIIVCYNV